MIFGIVGTIGFFVVLGLLMMYLDTWIDRSKLILLVAVCMILANMG